MLTTNKFVKEALANWNKRERRRADPFCCPTFELDELEIEEIEGILKDAKQLALSSIQRTLKRQG